MAIFPSHISRDIVYLVQKPHSIQESVFKSLTGPHYSQTSKLVIQNPGVPLVSGIVSDMRFEAKTVTSKPITRKSEQD